MIVNHNIPALFAYNSLASTNRSLEKSIDKLSTGLRINSAADDAAGLAISEKMRSQIRGLDQAVANSQDGINMIQTAEGALNETHSILQRMRELSVQAANDTLTANDRQAIQLEVDQLKEEIGRISDTTQFNKKKLLNGDAAALWSSDDLSTQVFVRGGLREVDQFGQKAAAEGNYKIDIEATPGQAEIQKTDIFKVKHAVQNEMTEQNFGHANLSATVNNTGVADLTFVVEGKTYNVAISGVSATNPGAEFFVQEFNNQGDINDYIEAVDYDTTNANVEFVAVDPGVSFDITENAGDNVFGGTLASTATNVAPSDDNITNFTIDNAENFLRGDYSIETEVYTGAGISAQLVDHSVYMKGESFSGYATAELTSDGDINASIQFEVVDINTATNQITYSNKYYAISRSGAVSEAQSEYTFDVTNNASFTSWNLGAGTAEVYIDNLNAATSVNNAQVGDKIVLNYQASAVGGTDEDIASFDRDGTFATYVFSGGTIDSATTEFNFFQLNTDSTSNDWGTLHTSQVTITFDEFESAHGTLAGPKNVAGQFTIEGAGVGDVADGSTSIYDIDKFWDSNGNFLVEDPQTLTLVQGNGEKTSVTIYEDDSMDTVASKLNEAVRDGLGQGELEGLSESEQFVTYVDEELAAQHDDGPYSVAGTMVVSSAINGGDGEITFVGDEEFTNALSLNIIQESEENNFTVNITDAHDGSTVAEDVNITGNTLIGVVHNNVDVKFDAMADIDVSWSTDEAKWVSTGADGTYSTMVHLADNTTVFQVGANEGEDMGINVGNMSAESLGVDGLIVTNREDAANSITTIDGAIARVSDQRATLGAYQNRLEHTINNLTTASENLTAAESRIRDLDMAKEMMNFSKLQILSQSGTSMLAQANQLPQNVLQLLR